MLAPASEGFFSVLDRLDDCLKGNDHWAENIRGVVAPLSVRDRRRAWLYVAEWYFENRYFGNAASYCIDVIFASDISDAYNDIAGGLLRTIDADHSAGASAFLCKQLGYYWQCGACEPADFTRAVMWWSRGAELGDLHAKAEVGRAFFAGRGIERDIVRARALLEESAADPLSKRTLAEGMVEGLWPPPPGLSYIAAYEYLASQLPSYSWPLLTRLALGIGCDRDVNGARAFVARHPGDRWVRLLDTLVDLPFQKFAEADPVARSLVASFANKTRPVASTVVLAGRNRKWRLAILSGILARCSDIEFSAHASAWREIAAQYYCRHRGWNYRRALKQSLAVGSVFNSLSPYGMPQARWPLPDDKLTTPSDDGVVVHTFRNRIVFLRPRLADHFARYAQGLLTARDIVAALALTFTSVQKRELPAFSIERYDDRPFENYLFGIQRKRFKPAWLAATEIGKSLYLIDQMMPIFGLSSLFSTTTYFDNATLEGDAHRSGFYDAIDQAHGRYAKSGEITSSEFQLVHVETRSSHRSLGCGWAVTTDALARMDVRFNSARHSYAMDGSSEVVGSNEVGLISGRRAAIGTERFEELARAFPVFARVRLFYALCRLFAAWRDESGLSLSAPLQFGIDLMVRYWTWRKPELELVLPKYEGEHRDGVVKITEVHHG